MTGNPYHEPAGSSKGGQFASKPGGSDHIVDTAREAAGLTRKYIPFDKNLYSNVGEYFSALIPYDKSLVGPAGQVVEVWKTEKDWIAQELDPEGNEIQSEYSYRKSWALLNAAAMQNDWYKK